MPAPLTHIVFALKVIQLIPKINTKKFILGTSFPDIRFLVPIEKNETHSGSVTWDMVKKENDSFQAGLLFHSLVDILSKAYRKSARVYDQLPDITRARTLMNNYEDMLLYDKAQSWKEISGYFDTILPQEKCFGIEEKYIYEWHNILKLYSSKKPSPKSLSVFSKIIFPETHKQINPTKNIENAFSMFEKTPQIADTVFDFYNSFEAILTTQPN
ncbi:hypothetical protein HN446_02685 [bacterium]|jgi:hypothetical protein|nr:hypothetical protein [bacterium]